MNTGEKIRIYRMQRKITQQEMADALNVSQRAFSKIENGEVSLKFERLAEIAKLLNIGVNDLFTDSSVHNFDVMNDQEIGNEKVLNKSSKKECELYEKIISRQQNEIDYLKGLVNFLAK